MEHSDSKGSYAVSENIRRMKPRGTMVKKIKGHYYVYGMKSVKDEKPADGRPNPSGSSER